MSLLVHLYKLYSRFCGFAVDGIPMYIIGLLYRIICLSSSYLISLIVIIVLNSCLRHCPSRYYKRLNMAFVLIEFSASEGGGISIVHNEWMSPRKTEVYWPPYKEQSQFNRALKRGEKVNTETWKLFKIARCFYSSDDYEKIHTKLKDCEITSDIQSDDDNAVSKIRKRIPNKKYFVISDEETDNDESQLLRPPRNLTGELDVGNLTKLDKSSLSQRIHESIKKQSIHNEAIVNFSNDKENIETLIQLQERNIELLMHIKEQNKQILTIIGKQDKVPFSSLPDLPIKFPLDTIHNLQILDRFLKENTGTADILCSYLSSLDEVAKNYNFYGKRAEKEAFSNLTLCSIIIRAVKITHSAASDKEVEDIIKVWLKHAPERIRNSEKRVNKHAPQT
ncbi:hypothetical protein NQ318_004588 [Aromia moschata]|uniref:DUF4806 domain-containing protein n=1 Tax=Aromia moschata TaxID=1265417 RepID=A0AAV8XPL4_9CUCU|nr:hypothetical protein NQ318_004588 [Aromia moschata]